MSIIDDRFDQALAEIEARNADERARSRIWLAHHWPDQHERCVAIGSHRVCRRCLTLYSSSLLVATLTLAGAVLWPERIDLWVIWGLCIPASVDFVSEQLGLIRYSARRQVVVTLLLGPALGVGFAHELDDRWSWEFWGPLLAFGTLWFVAAVVGQRLHKEEG